MPRIIFALFFASILFACAVNYTKGVNLVMTGIAADSNSAYIFGTYIYENKAQSLMGNDGGCLSLRISPVNQAGERPFLIEMDKDRGTFLYSLKPGVYEIDQLFYQVMNQRIPVKSVRNFIIEVTNDEILYIGKYFLNILIKNEALSIGLKSTLDDMENDKILLRNNIYGTSNLSLANITNTLNYPRRVYFMIGDSM